jgi:DNA repair protein RadC
MSCYPSNSNSLTQRERTLQGRSAQLSEAELLAVLLGTGCSGQTALLTATSLLELAGSLRALRRLGPQLLAMQRGIGQAKAARILAAVELGRRWWSLDCTEPLYHRLQSFDQVVNWARQHLRGLDHEELWSLALDGRNRLLQARCVSRGGQHGCAVSARDILRSALRDGASALVVVHNHPSGDPQPSDEDVAMTAALATACEAVGVPLLDHVIVAEHDAASLFELGSRGTTAA